MRSSVPVLLALALVWPACKRESTSEPSDPGQAPIASPRVEAEPSSGPTAISAEFAFVSFGGEFKGPFIEAADKGGPALITAVVEDDQDNWPSPLREAVLGQVDMDQFNETGEPVVLRIDPRTVLAAGFEPPRGPVWLIGPQGPCQARIGEPRVSVTGAGWTALEISWLLALDGSDSGCTIESPSGWAPVAILADHLPAELRYVSARIDSSPHAVALGQANDPHAASLAEFVHDLAAPSEDYPEGYVADELWVRETIIPDTEIAQVDFAALRRHHPQPGEDYDECQDAEQLRTLVGVWRAGVWNASGLTRVGMPRDAAPQDLIGAFVLADQLLWTVHSRYGQAIVAGPSAEQPVAELPTVAIHPEDAASFVWSVIAYCGP